MPSADDDVVVAMFQALAHAQLGRAGHIRLDASTPNGIGGLTLLAVDDMVWLGTIEPALRAAGVECVRVRQP